MNETGKAAVEQALRQFGEPLAPPSAPSNVISMQTARELIGSGSIDGKRLPLIEFMERQQAAIERLCAALDSIRVYGNDTLSGRVDGPDDRKWQRDSVLEMTRRARIALQGETKPTELNLGPNTEWHRYRYWEREAGPGLVTCNSRVVGGVLCRWWGDGAVPDGVALIDAAASSGETALKGDANG